MVVPPKISSVAIIAAFQTTDAEYDSRKWPWLLRIPRHHADITVSPTAGNRIRTRTIASDRVSPLKPGAMSGMSSGVAKTPISTIALTTSASSDATAPATRSASRVSPRASSPA